MEIEEGKTALIQTVKSLDRDDSLIRKIQEEEIPATPLPKNLRALVEVIVMHLTRLGTLCGSVPSCNGWSLAVREAPETRDHYSQQCFFAVKGQSRVRLSRSYLTDLVKPSEVLGVVQALSTLPAILTAWQRDVEKKKKDAAEKLKKTEGELVEAEKQLTDLCRELVKVSTEILNQKKEN